MEELIGLRGWEFNALNDSSRTEMLVYFFNDKLSLGHSLGSGERGSKGLDIVAHELPCDRGLWLKPSCDCFFKMKCFKYSLKEKKHVRKKSLR